MLSGAGATLLDATWVDKINVCKLKRYLLDQPLEVYVLKHTTWGGTINFSLLKLLHFQTRRGKQIGFRLLEKCASELRASVGTARFQIYSREENEECLLKKMCFRLYMTDKCQITKTRTAHNGYWLVRLPNS